ncbi:hypothetical protein QVD17_28680 [Tagetes erecta]|uniref:Uncharacterized protein n=1 Tax=Tagetes erecta TaxID=13708 RepID=A0AAD8NSM9_TARER|nr:hypothetical protein QVD17_28680 [Tagetes erecta]
MKKIQRWLPLKRRPIPLVVMICLMMSTYKREVMFLVRNHQSPSVLGVVWQSASYSSLGANGMLHVGSDRASVQGTFISPYEKSQVDRKVKCKSAKGERKLVVLGAPSVSGSGVVKPGGAVAGTSVGVMKNKDIWGPTLPASGSLSTFLFRYPVETTISDVDFHRPCVPDWRVVHGTQLADSRVCKDWLGRVVHGTQLADSGVCKDWLVRSVPPGERLLVQNKDSSAISNSVATALAILVGHYLELCRRSDYDRHKYVAALARRADDLSQKLTVKCRLLSEGETRLKASQNDLDVARSELKAVQTEMLLVVAERDHLKGVSGALSDVEKQLSEKCAKCASLSRVGEQLKAFRDWLLSHGFKNFLRCVRRDSSYVDKLHCLTAAANHVGCQDGLSDCFQSCQDNMTIERRLDSMEPCPALLDAYHVFDLVIPDVLGNYVIFLLEMTSRL